MKKIDIPFGASDSEPYYEEIVIPKGFTAIIEDGKVIIKKEESEDEKIKEDLIQWINEFPDTIWRGHYKKDVLAWLEKQVKETTISLHENKTCKENDDSLTYKGKPKFQKGDWIVKKNIVYHIDKISGIYLTLSTLDGTAHVYHKSVLDSEYTHLWTINDAKEGDILINKANDVILIFKSIRNDYLFSSHCDYFINTFRAKQFSQWASSAFIPATNEQCNLLFSKMKEMGYKWNEENKNLKKIIQKPAWSEEDSIRLQRIIDFLWYNRKGDTDTIYQQEQDIDWLKSIKERIEE